MQSRIVRRLRYFSVMNPAKFGSFAAALLLSVLPVAGETNLTLAPGRCADIVAVRGDVLTDIGLLQQKQEVARPGGSSAEEILDRGPRREL